MAPLDALLATTFAAPDAARAALDAAKGNLGRARKALAKKKRTPLAPSLGPRVVSVVESARSGGALASLNAGPLTFLEFGLPPELAAIQFAAVHWELAQVPLGGASLNGCGVTTREPRLRGGSEMALCFGTLASGAALVFRHGRSESSFVVVDEATERTVAGVEALLAEIEADAASRGHTDLFQSASRGRRLAGPPAAEAGADYRVYLGAELVQAELPSVDLYGPTPRVLLRLLKRRTLPAGDLWLVSRDGQLYQLEPTGPPRSGAVLCLVKPPP